jgi:putative transposase
VPILDRKHGAWMHEHRDSFPIALMCELLGVSKSGFYDAVDRPPSPRAQRRARIDASVRQVHADSHGIYGSGKVAKKLTQEEGLERACRNTVARAMREMGLKSRVSKGFTPSTTQADPSKQAAPNLLDRDFDATRPNQKWVTDITYLKTALGWVYLAVVLAPLPAAYFLGERQQTVAVEAEQHRSAEQGAPPAIM